MKSKIITKITEYDNENEIVNEYEKENENVYENKVNPLLTFSKRMNGKVQEYIGISVYIELILL